jgi:hypothetical protein
MIHKLYFIGLIFITVVVVYFYMINEREHRNELERIGRLERAQMEKNRELEFIRSRTEPCHIPGLSTPRSCYMDSEYKCAWNDLAMRCDKKY